MPRRFDALEAVRNTKSSMATGTVGGSIRAAAPARPLETATGAKRRTQGGSGLATPTYFVAASDAPAEEKAVANVVCDGSTDAATLDTYINGVGGQRTRVVLSNGTFNLEAGLVVSEITDLEGLGYGTILKFQASVTYNEIMIDAGFCNVRNMTLDGDMDNQPTPVYSGDWWHGGQTGIRCTAASTVCIIENVMVKNFTNVGIKYGSNVSVINCWALDIGVPGQNPTSHPNATSTLGFGFESYGSDSRIASSTAAGCQALGFKFAGNREEASGLRVSACGEGGSDSDDMDYDIEYGGIGAYSNPIISDCHVSSGHHGVVVFSGAKISNLILVNNGGSGIAGYPSQAEISNGLIYNSTGNGVFFIDPSHATLDGLQFFICGDSTHDGILLRPYTPGAFLAGDENVIRNCSFNGNTTARYHIKIYDTSIKNTWVYMNDMRVSGLTGRFNNNGTATDTTPGNRGIDF